MSNSDLLNAFLQANTNIQSTATPDMLKAWLESGGASVDPDKAVGSDSNGKTVASTTTMAELENISGTTARDTSVVLVDTDGVVINDNGVMKQASLARMWTYVSSKLTGAISGVLTTNLSASRAVVSDSSGKVSVASTTSAELDNVRGGVTDSGVTIDDADRFVHNDGGTMRQTSFTRVWSWIQGKLTGAVSTVLTSNLTASRNVITDSSGKLAVASYVPDRNLVTDSNGYVVTGNPVVNEVVYKNTISSVGTYNVVSNFNGGFTVSFVRTASTIYLTVTHTGTSSRWHQQYNINSSATVNNWTSSSGTNFPMNTATIPHNGGAMCGWVFCTDGSSQTTSIRVDYSIITNGASSALLYCRVV